MNKFLAVIFATLIVSPAFAITPSAWYRPLGGRTGFLNFDVTTTLSDTYRIGDEWGKHPVSSKDIEDPNILRMSQATARVTGATGFFIGVYGGKYVVASNHHVCPTAGDCLNTQARFTALSKQFTITEFYGTWTDIDLSLFAIEVTDPNDKKLLQSVASPFSFANNLHRGEQLVTIGYGIGSNPMRNQVVNKDSDCKVFSDEGEFRFMGDPDKLNPGPYKAWSFANGCDVSHGDSGSAMMDAVTGEVVGIIWTGKIPKDPKVQSTAFLDQLIANPTEDVWNELSFAVPAVKIGEFLTDLTKSGTLSANANKVLTDIVK